MRRKDHGLRIWWTAPLLGLALACGGGDDEPQPSGTAMGAPPPVEEHAENAAPVVESVVLSLRDPLPGTSLEVNAEAWDPDGDPYRLTFEWEINGESVATGPRPRLKLDDVRKDDRVEVTVVASDGRLESEPVRARTRIGNRPPQLKSVLLEPLEAVRPGDELLASPDASDPDEDPVRFECAWLVNGKETGKSRREFSTRGLDRGDKVRVRVVASDGTDTARAELSREITIGNSAPLIEKLPRLESQDGEFRYAFAAKDPDGDRNLRFELAEAPEGMRIDPILGVASWRPKASQAGVHQIEVRVRDSHGDASALQFEVTVTATSASSPEQPPAATP